MTTQWLPRLIAVTDAKRFGVEATIRAARHLCLGARPHSVVLQLREADLSKRDFLDLGQALGRLCHTNDQAFAINDRLDLALALGTSLFHRKLTSASVAEVRAALEPRVGSSWLTQGWHPADEAPPVGVEAVLVSPVLAPRKGRPALGLDLLGQAVSRVAPTPVFALGGVGSRDVATVLSTGTAGVAAQAAWYVEPDALLGALGIERAPGA